MIAGAALRPTRTRYAVLLFVYFAAFITYLDRVCISVATPAMQRDLGLSEIQFAWVFTVFYIAYSIFEIPTAWLGDRWGQRRMLIRIVGCWSLFTVFTGMARSLPMLLMTRTVFGAAEAGAFPTLSRALSRWFPMHERSRANGIMWMGARSGGALAPPVAVAHHHAHRVALCVCGFRLDGIDLVRILRVLVPRRSSRSPLGQQRGTAPDSVGCGAATASGERVPWKALLLNPTMIALFCSYFASGFGFQFFVTWLPTYLIREHGVTLQRSGLLAGLPLAAGAVGCLMGGVIADWITRRTGSVTIGRRSVGVSGFLLGAVGYTAAMYGHSAGAAIAFLALASGAHDLTLPVLWATTTDAGGRFGGTAAGFVNFASSLSGMLAPLSAALLQRMFGSFHAVFFAAAAMYLFGAALWLVIDPRKSLSTKDDHDS